jgi:parallel beta-helix repeat protein
VVRGNVITDNSYGGWNWGWMGGGTKFVASVGLTVDGNVVANNNGPGIWCDIGCSGATISNNIVHDNLGPNVMYEVSSNARITNNRIWGQAGAFRPALYVASSGSVEVDNNLVAWSGRGIQVLTSTDLIRTAPW